MKPQAPVVVWQGFFSALVRPSTRDLRSSKAPAKPVTKLQLAGALYNWSIWLFIMLMVSLQFLGIV